jgi:hypothetical protein
MHVLLLAEQSGGTVVLIKIYDQAFSFKIKFIKFTMGGFTTYLVILRFPNFFLFSATIKIRRLK